MADTQKRDAGRNVKVPEFLREPLVAAQARLEHLEEEAQRLLRDLMDKGRASRKDLEHIVHKLSQQDWSIPEMRQRLEKLRGQGAERAAEWRGRADTFRAEALERMIDLQNRAVAFLGVATRDQVEELSKELDRLARRIDGTKPKRVKRAKTGTEA
jgi:uncharacterized protein HemX